MLELLRSINWNAIYVAVVLAWLTAMLKYKLLPSISVANEISSTINSRGGNIVVLGLFSGFILWVIMRGYAPMDFWTGTAFGMFAGGLLKAMTGESTKARATDVVDEKVPDVPKQ